jgi:signal-transduction protein with cAMP-binding, CBS, and nucleotidyltransferase domain
LNEDFHTPRYPKSDAAIQFIDSALEDNFIFASLTVKERRLLIDAMMMETVPAGQVIIKQGETGDFFYVIEEGQVSFAVDNRHVGAAGRGGSFGELALLCKFVKKCTKGDILRYIYLLTFSLYHHRQLSTSRNLHCNNGLSSLEGRPKDISLHVSEQQQQSAK